MVTEVSEVQPEKEALPIFVTLGDGHRGERVAAPEGAKFDFCHPSGMVTEVSELQPQKALSPITVTPLGWSPRPAKCI